MNRILSRRNPPGPATAAGRWILAACALASALQGCSVVGPEAIRGGRMAYNEAIAETNAQQMLLVPVHNRYEEGSHLLAVASVTANVRVSGRAGVEAGFGNSNNYEGNLVPFSGGFVYEENPTISYTPVTGEAYLHQLTSPVPLPLVAQLTRVLPEPRFAYEMLLASINGIHNPAFLYGDQQDDPRFDQVIELVTALTREQRLQWVRTGADGETLSMLIDNTGRSKRVAQLLELLGLPSAIAGKDSIVLPVSMALHSPDENGVAITTRSMWELMEILTAAVRVPPEDIASGAATAFPAPGRAGRDLAILYTGERPDTAYIAVEYRDGWYSIDDHDLATKRYFKVLGNLWSAAISQSLDDVNNSPVLTVPVSR